MHVHCECLTGDVLQPLPCDRASRLGLALELPGCERGGGELPEPGLRILGVQPAFAERQRLARV